MITSGWRTGGVGRGYERRAEYRPPAEPIPIEDPRGDGPLSWVNPVPEGKSVKNRMHIDVYGDTGELVALGATLLRKRDDDELFWDVLADPEGNEFCGSRPPGDYADRVTSGMDR